MSFFGFFGGGANNQVSEYKEKGAVIIDVRTPMEYEEGHAPDSVLMTLDSIPNRVEEIKALDKPVILVCRSGARAGSAEAFLKRHGIDAINGGPWQAVLD
jgi:rhodanese-related sulfurtransferase